MGVEVSVGAKVMRAGRGFAAGEFRRVRIVAINAVFAKLLTEVGAPITVYAAVNAGFPIAEGRPVTATAKLRTLGELEFAAIAWLEQFEIGFVVAVVAIVIALVAAMTHCDSVVLLWDDDFMVLVVLDEERLAFLVAGVAVEAGNILLQPDKVRVGLPDCGCVEEVCINEGMTDDWLGSTPKIRSEGAREGKKDNR